MLSRVHTESGGAARLHTKSTYRRACRLERFNAPLRISKILTRVTALPKGVNPGELRVRWSNACIMALRVCDAKFMKLTFDKR